MMVSHSIASSGLFNYSNFIYSAVDPDPEPDPNPVDSGILRDPDPEPDPEQIISDPDPASYLTSLVKKVTFFNPFTQKQNIHHIYVCRHKTCIRIC